MRAALLVLALAATPAVAEGLAEAKGAEIRALDRVTGEITDFTLARGETRALAELAVRVSSCRYPADDPQANAFAQVTIGDVKASTVLFDGWMIAASPALSALDHPRYDIWVLRCTP